MKTPPPSRHRPQGVLQALHRRRRGVLQPVAGVLILTLGFPLPLPLPIPGPASLASGIPPWSALDDDGDGWANGTEAGFHFTDPQDPLSVPDAAVDGDGDGFSDAHEQADGTDPFNGWRYPGAVDSDADGWPDGEEWLHGADAGNAFDFPGAPDGDNDGYSDAWEQAAGSDPADPTIVPGAVGPGDPAPPADGWLQDLFGDGFDEAWPDWWVGFYAGVVREGHLAAYPQRGAGSWPDGGPDTDGDGLSDAFEAANSWTENVPTGLDESGATLWEILPRGLRFDRVDSDGDGIGDGDEVLVLTPLMRAAGQTWYDPRTDDSWRDEDADGLTTFEEFLVWGTSPLAADSDGDTHPDGAEVQDLHTDPLDPLDPPPPLDSDSDGDGYSDAAEIAAGSNPHDAASTPATVGGGSSGGGGSGGGDSGTDPGSSSSPPPPEPAATAIPELAFRGRSHRTVGGVGEPGLVAGGSVVERHADITEDLTEYQRLLNSLSPEDVLLENRSQEVGGGATWFDATFYRLDWQFDGSLQEMTWVRTSQALSGLILEWDTLSEPLVQDGWQLDEPRRDSEWLTLYDWEVTIQRTGGASEPGWALAYEIRGPAADGTTDHALLAELMAADDVLTAIESGTGFPGTVGTMAFDTPVWIEAQRLQFGQALSESDLGARAAWTDLSGFPEVRWTEIWAQAPDAVPATAPTPIRKDLILRGTRRNLATGDANHYIGAVQFTVEPGYRLGQQPPLVTGNLPPGWVVPAANGTVRLQPPVEPGMENAVDRVAAEIAVDGNRDGVVTFSPNDETAPDRTFRFWLNHDQDRDSEEVMPATLIDCYDQAIGSRRDLEDFARLRVRIPQSIRYTGYPNMIYIGLKWKPYEGKPSINLYQHVEGGETANQYLQNDEIAQLQTDSPKYRLSLRPKDGRLERISPGQPFIALDLAWTSLDRDQANNLLFEACGEGLGQLILTFNLDDGTEIAEGPGVWLELLDIKKMYTRGGHRDGQVLKDLFKSKPWDETEDSIIFVHGWRTSPTGRDTFAETFYKRLWHRGFKGRFAAFQWDTYWNEEHQWARSLNFTAIDAALSRYNDSELIAWQSAENLKFFINEIVPGKNKHLAAHSMGNIVASEAVRLGANVNNYALMQAAVPSAAYDEHERTQSQVRYFHWVKIMGIPRAIPAIMWNKETPDSDTDPATRALAYRGRFKDIGAKVNLISFYLHSDYATFMPWEVNNDLMKPWTGLPMINYHYKHDNPPGKKLYRWKHGPPIGEPPVSTYEVDYYLTPTLAYEAMAHACSTWGKAMGAQNIARGAVDPTKNVDLGTDQFQLPDQPVGSGFHDQHSGQFTARIQNLKPFYDTLLQAFEMPLVP